MNFTTAAIFALAIFGPAASARAQLECNVGLHLNGTDAAAQIPSTYSGSAEITIEAWVRTTQSTGSFQTIVAGASSSTDVVHLQLANSGNIVIFTDAGLAYLPILSPSQFLDWHHVALTAKPGDIRLYRDGIQVGSNSKQYNTLNGGVPLLVGKNDNLGRYFKGSIDEVRIWSRARTQAEILATMTLRMDAAALPAYPSLIESLSFEGGNLGLVSGMQVPMIGGATLGPATGFLSNPECDCNQNGVPDADDIASGTAQDCNTNGIPDSCDLATLDCDQNGLIDSCEFAAGTANDCDANGLIDTCEIADDPATVDRNGNGVLDACECTVENYCVAQGNSSGQVATISASGLPSLGLNELVLHAQGAPAQKFGMFLYGRQENFVFSGDGALCVKPPLFRLYPLLVTDGGGAASRALDLGGAPFSSGPGQVQAGETWRFQFWFRDPAGGFAGFNFSDGLAVTFCP